MGVRTHYYSVAENRVVAEPLSSKDKLFKLHEDTCESALKTMVAKNHDYSGDNGDPFANFRGAAYLGIDPVLGIMLRIQDKLARINTFVRKGELKVKGEGVDDAIEDSINYLILIKGLIKEQQEKETQHSGENDRR